MGISGNYGVGCAICACIVRSGPMGSRRKRRRLPTGPQKTAEICPREGRQREGPAVASYNVFETISNQYFDLTNSERKVADYVLGHRMDAQYMSISDLAQECAVADATISRFCRRLGLSGYNAFKLELAKASMTTGENSGVQDLTGREDSCEQLFGKALEENISALEQSARLLDPLQVRLAADLLERAERVVCMGQGGSMVIAAEAWTMFSTITPKFIYVPDSHLQIETAALMGPGDVILFFSYSGSTRDLQDVLEVARQQKAKVILVTRFPRSPGGQMADVVLQCGANESPLQTGSAMARISQMFILDVLYRQVTERSPGQYEKSRERIAEAVARKHL